MRSVQLALLTTVMLCALPCLAVSGSWSDSQMGVTLQNRGVIATSSALNPPAHAPVNLTSSTTITTLSWSYKLMSPPPEGLQVKLCTASNHCVNIDGGNGQTRSFYGQSAQTSFRFMFYIAGKGVVYPPLRVLSNQVLVNYQ